MAETRRPSTLAERLAANPSKRAVTILKVSAPPQGFRENTVALVTFGFELTDFDGPFAVTRGHKRDDGEWRHYPVADIMGPCKVKLTDIPVCTNDKGTPYLQLPNLSIPREVCESVVWEVMARDTDPGDIDPNAPPPPGRD